MTDFALARLNMVNSQIRPNDVTDRRVHAAMLEVPREQFVPRSLKSIAYADKNISIDEGRCMMRPRALAKLLQAADLKNEDIVLAVGAGAGYSSALLGHLCESVIAIEPNEKLSGDAGAALTDLGVDNVVVVGGDLADGYAAEGPYDVIFVNGALHEVPDALTDQLKDGGRLVTIVGEGAKGKAMLFEKDSGVVTGRFLFNAEGRILPGFEVEVEFAL